MRHRRPHAVEGLLCALLLLLAAPSMAARSGEVPGGASGVAVATPSPTPGPLRVERATHVVNPLSFGGDTPRAELHGQVVVRNGGPRAVSQVKLTVRLLEEIRDYDLGTLRPGESGAVEWSLPRVGTEASRVEIALYGSVDGRRSRQVLDSREVAPPDPRGSPGGPPPGY